MQEELDKLETGLERIQPAAVPPALLARLRAAKVEPVPAAKPAPAPAIPWSGVLTWWRRLAFAAPAVAVVLLIWLAWRPPADIARARLTDSSGIKVDNAGVHHSLIASFETVAQLPDGEPVRLRCREWQDNVVIHDQAHGVMISQTTPRVEIIPVRLETY